MGRRPNYRFERQERDRKKAAKKAARLEAKQGKKDDGDTDQASPSAEGGEDNADRQGD
ncbi:MAG: hypothetical protein WD270_03680 [Acetobacterales bacterium]